MILTMFPQYHTTKSRIPYSIGVGLKIFQLSSHCERNDFGDGSCEKICYSLFYCGSEFCMKMECYYQIVVFMTTCNQCIRRHLGNCVRIGVGIWCCCRICVHWTAGNKRWGPDTLRIQTNNVGKCNAANMTKTIKWDVSVQIKIWKQCNDGRHRFRCPDEVCMSDLPYSLVHGDGKFQILIFTILIVKFC